MSNFDKIKPLQEKIDSLLLKIKKIKPNLYREYLLIVDDAINDFINLGEEYIKDNPQEFKLFLSKLNDIIKILNFITTKENIKESLRNWFKKEDWVRIDTQGNITGPCGTMKKGSATTRCLPRKKAQSLSKAERAKTSQKKAAASRKGKQFVSNTDKAKYKKGTYNKK